MTAPVWQTAAALPSGTVGEPWSAAVTATDDSAVTYAFHGAGPSWLSLGSGNGILSGIPSVADFHSFTIRASDAAGNHADRTFTLEIAEATGSEAPVWQTATVLPEATVGDFYFTTLTATDDNGPVTYSFQESPPEWLVLDGETGDIGGTPASAGTVFLTIRASDPDENHADRTFSIDVQPQPDVTEPEWQTTDRLPSAKIGVPWTVTVAATDDGGPVTYSFQGTPPEWVSLDPLTGELTGTTDTAGTYHAVIRATDLAGNRADRTFTIYVEAEVSFFMIGAGNSHSCGVTTDAKGWCWGSGANGRLGTGNTDSVNIPTAIHGNYSFSSMASGQTHTYGITTAGQPLCWGRNSDGQLGNDSNDDSSVPLPLAGGHTFIAVTAGELHSCGLKANGEAWCWGRSAWGRLGTGTTTTNQRIPNQVTGGFAFTTITGYNHTCGLEANGKAWCWGSGGGGRLGNNDTANINYPVEVQGDLFFKAISAGNGHTCGLEADGKAWCWGSGGAGQLGNDSTSDRLVPHPVAGGHFFVQISAGDQHTCGLKADGSAWCWGNGSSGRLGTGSTASSLVPVPITGDHVFMSIATGKDHSCGLTDGGQSWCWGLGTNGRLGNGSTSSTSSPAPVLDPII